MSAFTANNNRREAPPKVLPIIIAADQADARAYAELEKLALAAEDAAGGPPSAEQVDALIEYADALRDALEAATRVPVQGEPNDDRTPEFEAIEQELFKHQPLLSMQDGSIRGCKCMDRVFVTKTEDWGTHLAEVFTRLSRATVPDAALTAIRTH